MAVTDRGRWGLLMLLAAVVAEARAPVRVQRGRSARPEVFGSSVGLCAALGAADSVGNWWCLQGDGTMEAGSAVTLDAVGSPTTEERMVCPNGTNCTAQTQVLLNPDSPSFAPTPAAQYYASANTASPTGSFTTCALGQFDWLNIGGGDRLDDVPLISFGNLTNTEVWGLRYPGGVGAPAPSYGYLGAQVTCEFTCSGASLYSNEPVRPRAQYLSCGVFESGVRTRTCTYVAGSASTTCVVFNHAVASVRTGPWKWSVGVKFTTGNRWHGFMRGAFMTEKALSAAEITTIGQAAIEGPPTGMTFSRASVAECCTSEGTCAVVPENVPCVLDGAATTQAAKSNYLRGVFSENIAATWTNSVSTAAAQRQKDCISPYGIQGADSVEFAATTVDGGVVNEYYGRAVTDGGGGARVYSFRLRSLDGGSGSLDLCVGSGVPVPLSPCVGGACTCTTCAYTASWSRCSVTRTDSAFTSPGFVLGNLSGSTYGNASRPLQSICVAHAQVEDDVLTSYIPTFADGGVRAASTCSGAGC